MRKINFLATLSLAIIMVGVTACDSDDDVQIVQEEQVFDSAGREIKSSDDFDRNTLQVGPTSDEFISYIDEGSGDPIILLHGNPASSYLWRNVIPHLTSVGRVIAIDWMGFGQSGTNPDGDYSFLQHQDYLKTFIDNLGLQNVTLVMHDWASIPALVYAHQNQDNIKALASFEANYFPIPDASVLPEQAQQFRGPEGEQLIVDQNIFVNGILPNFTLRTLRESEFARYAQRFEIRENRFPLLAVPQGLPVEGTPADLWEQFGAASNWFAGLSTDIPKFFTYPTEGPGVLVTSDIVDPATGASMIDIVSNFPNTTTVPINGPGIHYLQEDYPHDIGIAIATWFENL